MRSLLVILGVTLTVYCSLDIELKTRYAGDPQKEAQFCQFRVCDDQRVYRPAAQKLWGTATPAPDDAVAGFLALLKRDPNFPFPWVNLGDALWAAKRTDDAQYCFRQAVALAPKWPPILMRAASFYFDSGNLDAALPLTSQILAQVGKYDSEIFTAYASQKDLDRVFEHGLPAGNARPALAWLNYLVGNKNVTGARRAWHWVRAHGFADPETTDAYVSMLLARHLPAEALEAWKESLGGNAGDYGQANYAFNGGFENEFSTSPLDWKSERRAGIEVTRDDANPDSGRWSLKIQLDGKHNIADTGVKLTVALPQGGYRLKTRIRTEGLTTDQGIQFRLRSIDQASSMSWTSRSWLGTNPWSTVETIFTVPANGNSYALELVRNPSLKFDSMIAGTVWMDSVLVEPYRN